MLDTVYRLISVVKNNTSKFKSYGENSLKEKPEKKHFPYMYARLHNVTNL